MYSELTVQWINNYNQYFKDTPYELFNKEENKIALLNKANIYSHTALFGNNNQYLDVILNKHIPNSINLPMLIFNYCVYLESKYNQQWFNALNTCKMKGINNITDNPIFKLFNAMLEYIQQYENEIINALIPQYFRVISEKLLIYYYKDDVICNNIINYWKEQIQEKINTVYKIYEE